MKKEEKKELQVKEKQSIDKASGEPIRKGLYFTPQVDIYETDSAITLEADMPGVSRENVDIDLREGVLTVTGSVDFEPQGESKLVYKEYEMGGYTRKFQVGEGVDQSKITANMDCGVLRVLLPKAEKLKPRKISIQGE